MTMPKIQVRFRTATSIIAVGALPLVSVSDGHTKRPQPRNVIVITLDTTRADVLTAYGGAKVETPALDRLAREGIVFEQATTPVPLTLPAHSSLFTGLFPYHHGVRDNTDAPLDTKHRTLAELLHSSGMHSAAFVASSVVGSRRGLARGFDAYYEGAASRGRLRRSANLVVDEAIHWVDRQGPAPFFMWLHLYDAHAPYTLPEPYRTMYEDAPYLGAIALMDAQIKRLLIDLELRHLLDCTLIVVAGDHGESLGEHGEDGHGMLLYQSTLRVPLLIRMPGVTPRRVSDAVRLIDVMPTVLDALGAAVPAGDGVSLLPLINGTATHLDVDVYSESLYPRRFGWSEMHSLRAGRFKFIAAPNPELYDLDTDQRERRNIYSQRPTIASAMAARLHILAATEGRVRPAQDTDSESLVRLAALGYVSQGSIAEPHEAIEPSGDPEACIAVYNAIVRTQSMSDRPAINRDDFAFAPAAFAQKFFDLPRSCVSRPFVSALLDRSARSALPVRPTVRTPHGASR